MNKQQIEFTGTVHKSYSLDPISIWIDETGEDGAHKFNSTISPSLIGKHVKVTITIEVDESESEAK